MELRLENGKQFPSPSRDEILYALSSLCNIGNTFAILESEEGQFIQAALQSDKSFLVCHSKSGNIDDLLVSCGGRVSLEKCVEAFLDFSSRGDKWRSMITWKSYDDDDYTLSKESRWILIISLIVVAIATFMAILY